ncbi:MAG: PEP-CTERM sorting domain-containing protein [Nitrospira sp.]|nr:MAG: PEP-CTERM sorting domain-containing protein [Nitrospira sp.]
MIAVIAAPAEGQAASFIGLGDLPGGAFGSRASGVSADGSVVGAGYSANGREAFRWTSGGGMVGLGVLSSSNYYSQGDGVSANGSVAVGYSNSTNNSVEAFRWTSSGGMVGLGDLPGGGNITNSWARGVSQDGSVVVGYGTSGGNNGQASNEAFRWTSGGGMVGLGDLPGGLFHSEANNVSGDGSTVVGFSLSDNNRTEAFRWTSDGGMVGLGALPSSIFYSQAYGVSADGSVVVGLSGPASSPEAFRWTSSGGMVGLDDLPGGFFSSQAYAVSGDGQLVVGLGNGANGPSGFIWDPVLGMRDLQTLLETQGGLVGDLAGWSELRPLAISENGTWIVGMGTNPSGDLEAWRAQLAPVPLPAAVWLFGSGVAGLVGLGLRRMKP